MEAGSPPPLPFRQTTLAHWRTDFDPAYTFRLRVDDGDFDGEYLFVASDYRNQDDDDDGIPNSCEEMYSLVT